jgi:hypothetical protein
LKISDVPEEEDILDVLQRKTAKLFDRLREKASKAY